MFLINKTCDMFLIFTLLTRAFWPLSKSVQNELLTQTKTQNNDLNLEILYLFEITFILRIALFNGFKIFFKTNDLKKGSNDIL